MNAAKDSVLPRATLVFGLRTRPCSTVPLIADLLGVGTTSIASSRVQYRTVFVLAPVASLVDSFYLNTLGRSLRLSPPVLWAAFALMVGTSVRWRWWLL